jgi:hypothetical protein
LDNNLRFLQSKVKQQVQLEMNCKDREVSNMGHGLNKYSEIFSSPLGSQWWC